MQTAGPESKSIRVGVAAFLVAAAAVLVYSASLPGTFQYDDVPTIVNNHAVTDSGLLFRYFADPSLFSAIRSNAMYRPVLLASYLLNHQIGGYSPFVWHLTNVLLHALNAALVALLAWRLYAILGRGRPAPWLPLLAGLAFALHPVHSEVANYVSARSGAIATAGFLGAFHLYLLATRGSLGRAARAAFFLLCVACYLLGLGGKEIAVAFPASAFVLELLDPARSRWRDRIVRGGAWCLPLVGTTLAYLWIRSLVLGRTGLEGTSQFFKVSGRADPYWGGGRTVFENLITQARVFWMYVRTLVLPTDLAVDRFVRVSSSLLEPAVLAATAGLAAVVTGLILSARRAPLVTLSGAVFFFGLAPTSTIVRLNVLMNEHRLYLPGIGVAILVGLVFSAALRRWPRGGRLLVVGVMICWAGLVVSRSLVWQDPQRLWEENVRVSPKSYRGHNQLGASFHERSQRLGSVPEAIPLLDRAIAEFATAAELYPDWYNAELNLGIAWRDRAKITGDDEEFERSVHHFERSRDLTKNSWRARYQLAATYGAWKKYDEAIRRYEEMAEADRAGPDDARRPLYLLPIARLELERGEPGEAEALYREVLASHPEDREATFGLAKALAAAGRRKEGVQAFRTLLSARPDDPMVAASFAHFLATLDPPDRRNAAALFRKALSLGYRASPEEYDLFLSR